MTPYEIDTNDADEAYPTHWLQAHERPTAVEGLDLSSLQPGATPTDPTADAEDGYPAHWTN